MTRAAGNVMMVRNTDAELHPVRLRMKIWADHVKNALIECARR
jgi:hypothetical protein